MTYCSQLTDSQVMCVYATEKDRFDRGGDPELYYEVREEMARRGLSSDHIDSHVVFGRVL